MSVNFVIARTFPVRNANPHQRLLPVLIGTTFFSSEGYRSAYFLGPVSMDIRQSDKSKFAWSVSSETRPLLYHAISNYYRRASRDLFGRYLQCHQVHLYHQWDQSHASLLTP